MGREKSGGQEVLPEEGNSQSRSRRGIIWRLERSYRIVSRYKPVLASTYTE
jgi:hypothetical protein